MRCPCCGKKQSKSERCEIKGCGQVRTRILISSTERRTLCVTHCIEAMAELEAKGDTAYIVWRLDQ